MINFLLTLLFFICSFPINVWSQTSLSYQRKSLTPDFFVPQNALNVQEKLPPIRSSSVVKINSSISNIQKNPSSSEANEEVSANEKISEFDFKTLAETPRYKQNYDTYLQSIKNVAQTGVIPSNPELEEDLKKMDSNERFLVK